MLLPLRQAGEKPASLHTTLSSDAGTFGPAFRFLSFGAGGLKDMITTAHIQPLVALIAGVLILVIPRLLNYIVAIYLIVVGIIGLGLIHR
jgi:hypothetical protein